MATPYCTYTDVANFLGVTFTASQQAEATVQAGAATEYIDRKTGRTWQGSVFLDEQHTVYGPWIFLKHKPVASIQAVRFRAPTVNSGAAPSLLGWSYELLDAANGKVTIGTQLDFARDAQIVSWTGYIMSFDYTATLVVPADINRAATLITAYDMFTTLTPTLAGIKQIRMMRDISVTYDYNDWLDKAELIIKANTRLVFA